MAYSEIAGNGTRLALRMMDQFDARPLPGAEGGTMSTFSPDGQWIAYLGFQESKLKKIPVTGGTSITLADGVSSFGLTWGEDDTIVFTGPRSLMRVPAAGGTPQTLTAPNPIKGEAAHRWPHFLPGSQALLFSIATGDSSQIAVLDLKKGGYRVLVNNGSAASYAPTGHLVYVRGGTLFAVPFDLRQLAVTGSEAPVIEHLSSLVGGPGIGDYAFSGSGLLTYMAGQQGGKTILAWADRKGVVQPAGEPQPWGTGRLSPDGRFIANELLSGSGGGGDVWTYEVERKTLTRLTFEGTNEDPIWTPDSRRVTFSSTLSNKHGIAWVPADGSGKAEFLLATDAVATPNSWTPDGKFLVYSQPGPNKNSQLWLLPTPGTGDAGKPRLLHDSSFAEFGAQVSPDGKSVAYVSTESGGPEVYLQPFPAPGAKLRISTQGGSTPRWSHDGRELFYWTGQGTAELMRVEIQTAPALHAGIPESLFRRSHGTTWDVAPDAKRFLIEEVPDAEEGGRRLEAVVNWFDELRRRAPSK
jgi:serine/threonine-protein kinase